MSNAVEHCPIREYFLSGDREWEYGEVRYRVTGPVNTYVADDDKTSEVCIEFAPIGHAFLHPEDRYQCFFSTSSTETNVYTFVEIHFEEEFVSAEFVQTVDDVKRQLQNPFIDSDDPLSATGFNEMMTHMTLVFDGEPVDDECGG